MSQSVTPPRRSAEALPPSPPAADTVAVDYGLTQVALFPLFNIEYTAARGVIATVIVLLIRMALIIWSNPITTKINNWAVGAEVVDTALHTRRPGAFAIDNLVPAVDTADVAALAGG